MTWGQVQSVAKAGVPVRRASWLGTPSGAAQVVYVAGAGTTRAVAVYRLAGAESVVTAATFTASDRMADDWEVAP